jgi:hypothetical protein
VATAIIPQPKETHLPLVGFISADGSSDQPEGLGHCSFEYALAEASTGDSDAFPVPYPILKGIIEANKSRGDYISVTSLLHCLRNDYLVRNEDYYAFPDSLYPAFRGTLFHGLMEQHAHEGADVEKKVVRTYKGVEIGGTTDSIIVSQDPDGYSVLDDWKTTENLPKYNSPYSAHIQQVNLYRWLFGLDPKKTHLQVTYFSMGGFKQLRLKDGTGVGRGGKAPVNQVWTDAQVEAFLDDRLMKLRVSFMSRTPLPYAMVQEDEKWLCAYCPVKPKCDTLADAERESNWRRRAGLPPEGSVGDVSAVWQEVVDRVYPIVSFQTQDVATTKKGGKR